MIPLARLFLSAGINPASDGWTFLAAASGISANGRFVVGYGIRKGNNEAFLADLAGIPPFITTATLAGNAVTLNWNIAAGLIYSGQRAPKPGGSYSDVALGLTAGTYTETPPPGAANFYRVSWE